MRTKNCPALLLALLLPLVLVANGQHPTQHHNPQPDKRLDGVNDRGDHAMGFSHEKTKHHFRLTAVGGVIEVTANSAKDTETVELIRTHLRHISTLFKDGDFSKPMFTHGETPAGVDVMKRLKGEIAYAFDSLEQGGRVRIESSNPEAVSAIHEFMRYQIKDHQTGDPMEVEKDR